MLRAIRLLPLAVLLGAAAVLQEHDGYRMPEFGLAFDRPGDTWAKVGEVAASSGGREYEFRAGGDEDRSISLMIWQLASLPGLSDLCASEESQMAARGDVQPLARTERGIADWNGMSTRYRLERADGEGPVAIDATYFATERFLGRLAVNLPGDELERLDETVRAATSALRREEPSAIPVEISDPLPGNVLTVVHATRDADLPYAYLEALPGAARTNAGLPVVLAVGSSLDLASRTFVEKYRPESIRRFGPAHAELPQARAASDDWSPGGTVVVSERRLGAAIPAACLATRLQVPLLVEADDFPARLRALSPSRVFTLGEVSVDGLDVPVFPLREPEDVARAAGGTSYIAVCNVAAGAGAETAVLAAALAATRDGVVLPLDMSMTRHRVPLRKTERCPPGLEDVDGVGKFLVGTIETDGGDVLAGAVQTTVVRVATNDSPRYGRLRIDLDGDGLLEPDEEPRIGSRVELGGESFHLTYTYRHDFVPYLADQIFLDEFDPEAIRSEIRALAAQLGTVEYVAVVGTPDRVPFCYREATGYFETYDIKQELPTDAPYANLDDDSYLELAVGRLPVYDLIEGSAVIATTLAYPRLQGDWIGRGTMIQPGFHELEGSLPWVLPNAEALIRGIEGDLAAAGVATDGYYRDDVEIDDVIASMSGSAWIAYFNHSGPGSWGIHPGSSIVTGPGGGGNNRSLPPLEGAPIVFGGGCSSAALDITTSRGGTFPERFFQLGAVAYLGNTRVAYARSEHLVQLFFARLAAGEGTLGQAYRDGRNYLAHVLDGGHLVGELHEGVDLGVRDFLWAQHRIMNLFGDPALVPRRTAPPATSAIDVSLAATDRPDRWRLTVTNRGAPRLDPLQMMPASGQGAPREFFVRTGPGMTSSHLPHHFVDDGLSPVRTVSEVPPGAWVDVELPRGAHDVTVTRVEGPDWADRGFTVRTGPRGEPRLQMYVPLVHSTLERGEGPVATQVVFEVACPTSAAGGAEQSAPRVRAEAPWTWRPDGEPRISAAAEELLARIRRRHGRPAEGLRDGWTMANPQPRLYGEAAHFRGTWDDDGRATLTAHDLPPSLAPRRAVIEEEMRRVAELPFGSPVPPLDGMDVTATSDDVLLLISRPDGDEQIRIEVHVAPDGTVQRTVRQQLGLREEATFTWREVGDSLVLERCARRDPVRPENEVIHEITWSRGVPVPRPERVTLRIPGKLPRDVHFAFSYARSL